MRKPVQVSTACHFVTGAFSASDPYTLLPEDEDEWDSFFNWALSEVFNVDENTDQEAAFAEAEDAMEWLRGLFEEKPEQREPVSPYPLRIKT